MFEINIPKFDMEEMAEVFANGTITREQLELMQSSIDAYDDADFVDIWGAYSLSVPFEEVTKTKEFIEQENKFQLGTCHFHNATHTRYAHALGVAVLSNRLVDICDNKFGDKIIITEEDRNAIRLFGFVHDIGHHRYSHSAEIVLPGDHETRTINILKDSNSDIHKVIIKYFGKEVLLKLLGLINVSEYNNNEFLTMIRPLLSGGIDIDRIDYIFRDARFVLGEAYKKNYSCLDFSDLLNYIDMEIVDGKSRIVFDEEGIERIKSFFAIKFELHDVMYYGAPTSMLEEIYYKLAKGYDLGITWDSSKNDIDSILDNQIRYGDLISSKYSNCISKRDLDGFFMIKVISDDDKCAEMRRDLFSKVPELNDVMINGINSCLHTTRRVINMYKSKDAVLIRFRGGVIKNLSEVESFDSSLKKVKNVIGVDVSLLSSLKGLDIDEVTSRVNDVLSSDDEIKKYIYRYRDPFLKDYKEK